MLSKKTLLLKTIRDKQDVSILLNRKATYSEISILLKQLQKEGNITISLGNISLTTNGISFLENEIAKSFSKKKDQWILPQYHYRKSKIDIDKIVLPNKT